MSMATGIEERVLPGHEVGTLADHEARGGGRAWRRAQELRPGELIDLVAASGLRGRGGAGFPTGTKWRTVAEYGSSAVPATGGVDRGEGGTRTFKDRWIPRRH